MGVLFERPAFLEILRQVSAPAASLVRKERVETIYSVRLCVNILMVKH